MGGDDFDKRDTLSPIRKAVQEGIKEKEMANDAWKASQIRNTEAMWSQIDYFLSGLCELFDVPEQIEKTIRQSGIDGKPHKYEFSLSARSFVDFNPYFPPGLKKSGWFASLEAFIKPKFSEALPQMDNELLEHWIEKLFSQPILGNWKVKPLLNLSPSQRQRVLLAPEQGTSAFLSHMKQHFFYLLREGFLRDGIELLHCAFIDESLYNDNEKEIECGTIRDYIGEVCYENSDCNRRCDWPAACSWAFEICCPECKSNPHGIDDDCTNMVRNYQMSFPMLKFQFTINPE